MELNIQRRGKNISFPVHRSDLGVSQSSCHVLLGVSVVCLLSQPCWCAVPPQFVHRALAHELLNLQGGPSCAYYLALAQTYLLKEDFSKCEECLREAININYLVILCVFQGCSTMS